MWHAEGMAQIVCPLVSVADRTRLEAIVADRNRAQKHVARARIILRSADQLSVTEVARRAGVGRPAVWRWQRRFAEAGVEGLLHDATRKPGKAPLGEATVRRVVTLSRRARRSRRAVPRTQPVLGPLEGCRRGTRTAGSSAQAHPRAVSDQPTSRIASSQACAQRRQASAQIRQCSCCPAWRWHSSPHT